MHGGAKGSGAPNGERNGSWKHGNQTVEAIAERREVTALVRLMRSILRDVDR